MWDAGKAKGRKYSDKNEELLKLEGELSDEQVEVSLAEFMYANPAFFLEVITKRKIILKPFQEIILKGWMRNDFSIYVAGRGLGKTQVYSNDNKVITKSDGMIGLVDLFPNIIFKEEEYWMDVPEVELWNGSSWQKMSKVLVQPNKDCNEIETRFGYSLGGSTRHLIKVYNPETFEIEWKRYSDIKIGDYACISRNEVEINTGPDYIDASYSLGLTIGSGSYSESLNNVGFYLANEQLKTFAENTKYKFLEEGEKKGTSPCNEEIPSQIFKNKKNLKACLQGLFDSCRGYGKNTTITFRSVSKKLAKQVHLALLNFGIISKIKIKRTNCKLGKLWIVTISGSNLDLFLDRVGFRSGGKNNQEFSRRTRSKNVDTIPNLIPLLKKIKSKYTLSKEQQRYWYDEIEKRTQNSLSYSSLKETIDFFNTINENDSDLLKLKAIHKENFFFDKIVKKTEFKHHCVDFNVPTGEMYWSNGFISHNTYLCAIFCLLWALYNPNNRIVLISFAFRATRRILEQIEKIVNDEDATILKACFPKDMSRKNDEWKWILPNGASILCVPLGDGTKIRGIRADTVIIDEANYVNSKILNEVVRPFLVSNNRMNEQMKIDEIQNRLIADGTMKEEDRITLEENTKVISLSSAGFQFEDLYKNFTNYVNNILTLDEAATGKETDEEQVSRDIKYFVMRMGYEAAPSGLVNKKIVEEAKGGQFSQSMFDREYRAIFTPDSGGYFSAQKMKLCTVEDGMAPCIELVGDKASDYILAIDPSLSSAEYSDHFAMCVLKIVKKGDKQIPLVVHNYAVAGGNMKDHHLYLAWLFKHFNIVYLAIDSSQGDNEFITSANNSKLFKDIGLELIDIDADFKKDSNPNIGKEIKNSHNKSINRIVQKQPFTSAFQKNANELLQASFDFKNIMFAGKLAANSVEYERYTGLDISALTNTHPYFKDGGKPISLNDFMEDQDRLMDLVKQECSLVELKTSGLGNQSWDLPEAFRRSKSPDRVRKDNYSALLLGNYAFKLYTESQAFETQEEDHSFVPFSI